MVIKPWKMRWAGHVALTAEIRNAYSILVGKPEGRKPIERPRRRWKDNLNQDFRAMDWEVDCIYVAQDKG
jgi:hypothetical protein